MALRKSNRCMYICIKPNQKSNKFILTKMKSEDFFRQHRWKQQFIDD